MTAIIGMSFKEIYKKKAFTLGFILSLAYLMLYGVGLNLIYKNTPEDNLFYRAMMESQLISLGLYFAGFIVALLVVLSSSGSISSEIENGIMYSVASKPISRTSIILGKFVGIGGIMVVYASGLFAAVIVLNVALGGNLARGIGIINILEGLAYFDLIPIILLAVTMLGSAATSTIGAGIISIVLYGLASVGGMLEQFGIALKNESLANVGIISSLIMPSDAIHRKMTTSMFDMGNFNILGMSPIGGSVSEPSMWMVIYSILYVILIIWFAVGVFNRKDL